MRIKSRSSKKNKNSFSIEIPLPLIQKEGSFLSFNFFILNPGSSTFFLISFFSWILDFISNFLLLSHRYILWIHREPFLLYESILFYYIPISSRYPPKKIPNWIQNWRVSVSLSMRLCTLEIGINFLILAGEDPLKESFFFLYRQMSLFPLSKTTRDILPDKSPFHKNSFKN